MEQLEIILSNYDKKRDPSPIMGRSDKKDGLQDKIKATVLEASKSFQSSESKGSMLGRKEAKEPTGNRVRFSIPAESEGEEEPTPS